MVQNFFHQQYEWLMFYGNCIGKYSIHGAHIWVYVFFCCSSSHLLGLNYVFLIWENSATPATRPVPAAEFQDDASMAPDTKRQRAKEYSEATLGNPNAPIEAVFFEGCCFIHSENQLRRDSGARSEPPTVLPVAPDPYLTSSSQTRARTRRLLAGKPN